MDYEITRGLYAVRRNNVAKSGGTVNSLSYSFWPGSDLMTITSIQDGGRSTVGEGTAENRPRGSYGTGILPRETGAIPKTVKPIGEKWNVPRMDSSPVQPDYSKVLVEDGIVVADDSSTRLKIEVRSSAAPERPKVDETRAFKIGKARKLLTRETADPSEFRLQGSPNVG